MILSIVIAGLIGLFAGVITGIIPGLHINTITAILISSLGYFAGVPGIALVVFVVCLALTHTILDFIPSIFTGAPDEESFLSVLPGHEMLMEGKGKEATFMVLIGALSAIPLIAAITPIFIIAVPKIFELVEEFIPFILIFVSFYTVLREKYIWAAFTVFFSTGLLGFAALNLPTQDQLLPLLSGLFGGSGLVLSIVQKTKVPKQKNIKLKDIDLSKKEYFKAFLGAAVSAPMCSFLPAIGAGHAATISSEVISQSRRGFLMMLGAINVIVMTLSFATLYLLDKTRTGAAVAIKEILLRLNLKDLVFIIIIACITIICAAILAVYLSSLFLKLVQKVNYRLLSLIMLLVLLAVILLFSNALGLIVFITGTAWGIFTVTSEVRRINCMAALLVPTIILYLIN